MLHHLKCGVTEYSSEGVKFTPSPCEPRKAPQAFESLWEALDNEPIEIKVGSTGYFDCTPLFERSLMRVKDAYGRRGIAIKMAPTCKSAPFIVETLFERFMNCEGGTVTSGVRGGPSVIIFSTLDCDAIGRLQKILEGGAVRGYCLA